MRRAFRHAGLDGRARRPVWLRRINSVEPFEILLGWLRRVRDGAESTLPGTLAAGAFAWTGGGQGPVPPIDDRP